MRDMLKKIVCLLLYIALILCLTGCDNKEVKIEYEFSVSMFDETFKEYKDFDVMSENLVGFYNAVVSAYNKSNEKDFETFVISDISQYDNYFESNRSDLYAETGKSLYAGLTLNLEYTKTRAILAEWDFVTAVGAEGNEQDFLKLKTSIYNAYNAFTSPIDFDKMPEGFND